MKRREKCEKTLGGDNLKKQILMGIAMLMAFAILMTVPTATAQQTVYYNMADKDFGSGSNYVTGAYSDHVYLYHAKSNDFWNAHWIWIDISVWDLYSGTSHGAEIGIQELVNYWGGIVSARIYTTYFSGGSMSTDYWDLSTSYLQSGISFGIGRNTSNTYQWVFSVNYGSGWQTLNTHTYSSVWIGQDVTSELEVNGGIVQGDQTPYVHYLDNTYYQYNGSNWYGCNWALTSHGIPNTSADKSATDWYSYWV